VSPLDAMRLLWSRLTVFDRLLVWTTLFLVVTVGALRVLGYE